jgi:hypothetical protein
LRRYIEGDADVDGYETAGAAGAAPRPVLTASPTSGSASSFVAALGLGDGGDAGSEKKSALSMFKAAGQGVQMGLSLGDHDTTTGRA